MSLRDKFLPSARRLLASLRDHREMRRYSELQVATSITNASETRDLVED